MHEQLNADKAIANDDSREHAEPGAVVARWLRTIGTTRMRWSTIGGGTRFRPAIRRRIGSFAYTTTTTWRVVTSRRRATEGAIRSRACLDLPMTMTSAARARATLSS